MTTKRDLSLWKKYRSEVDAYNRQKDDECADKNEAYEERWKERPYSTVFPMRVIPLYRRCSYEGFMDWLTEQEDK